MKMRDVFELPVVAPLLSRRSSSNAAAVHAVNCHDDLVSALASLVQYAQWQMIEGVDYHPTLPSAVNNACAVLAKARGE